MCDMSAVFYFNFYDENTNTEKWCGFLFNPNNHPWLKDDDYEVFYDEVASDIEDQYGVHDWSSRPAGIYAIGYNSYEIEDINGCMDTWQDTFVELVGPENVTKWVEFDHDATDNDLSIYNKIFKLV